MNGVVFGSSCHTGCLCLWERIYTTCMEVYTFSVVFRLCRVVSRTGEQGKRQTMEDLIKPPKDFALNDMSMFYNLPIQRNLMKCLLQY